MKLQVSIPVFALFLLAIIFLSPSLTTAAEPSWYPYVVARGPDRIAIQNTPMHRRPYRPMHFYGNAVRRGYHRGNPALLPRGVAGVGLGRNVAGLGRNVVGVGRNLLLLRR